MNNSTQALQLYYTSCVKGLSGHAGFQTRAESDGLLRGERREVESHALYQPPRDLPREPDPDTILEQFPSSIRKLHLSSGRTALIRAVYIGKDYSGRWGNYFAHALVYDTEPEGAWAIDSYGWDGWVGQLSKKEEEREPKPLAPVAPRHVFSNELFAFSELSTFLTEERGREPVLAGMIRAALRRATDSRSLVVREELELNGVYWVACVLKAFPTTCQQALTFSTFLFDPRSAMAVNATVGESDFLFNDGERRFQFYIFDFVSNEHSEVSKGDPWENEYSECIARWMCTNPALVERFHAFAALFDHQDLNGDLIQILRLFRMSSGEPHPSLTTEALLTALDFVRRRAQEGVFSTILDTLGDVTGGMANSTGPDGWEVLIKFLMEGAKATGQSKHRDQVAWTWIKAFDRFVLNEHSEAHNVLMLRSAMEREFGADFSRLLAKRFLAERHIKAIQQMTPDLTPSTLTLIMGEFANALEQLDRGAVYEAPEIQALIKAVLQAPAEQGKLNVAWALTPFREEVDALESVSLLIMTTLQTTFDTRSIPDERRKQTLRELGENLNRVVVHPKTRFELIKRLKTKRVFWRTLAAEWEADIKRAANPTEAHYTYSHEVLSDGSDYAKLVTNVFAGLLLRLLAPDRRVQQAKRWVNSRELDQFNDKVVRSILEVASEAVSLKPGDPDAEHLAKQINSELNKRSLKYIPPRLRLRALTCRLIEEPQTPVQGSLLDQIDASSYQEFLRVVLPELVHRAVLPKDHKRLLVQLVSDSHRKEFYSAYSDLLSKGLLDKFIDAEVALTAFWLELSRRDSAHSRLGMMRKSVLKTLVARVAAMPKKARADFERQLKTMVNPGSPKAANFIEMVEKENPSLLGKILSLFSR